MDVITYQPLYLLAVLVLLAGFYVRSLVERRKLLTLAAFVLRCLGVVLLILALCRPFIARQVRQAHVVFLVDVSRSVDPKSCQSAITEVRRLIEQLGSGDSYSLMEFAADVRQADLESLAERLAAREKTPMADGVFRSKSRIARALRSARMAFPSGKAKRIVLFSDGHETSGGLADAVDILRKENVDVVIHILEGLSFPEASVISVTSNTPTAYFGEKVRITANLSSNRDVPAELRIYCRGVLEKKVPVKLKADQDNRVTADIIMNTAGSAVWSAEIVAADDHFAQNNTASCTIDVRGRAKVLLLHRDTTQMRPLARALKRQGMDVDVRGVRGLPVTMQRMLAFDAIVIADVPATEMSTRQMLNLKSYVADFGGGLIMLGSENSFGLGGYYQTPVEEVLPIVSRYEKEKERPSLAMVLVIDKSGSMEGLPIALARQAAKASVELLGPRDRIAIVAFDGKPYVVCEMTSATETNSICAAIDQISAGGGTNMYPAMKTGMELLERAFTKIKHMVLLGDGQSMPGAFEDLAGEMAGMNMTVSTVALGEGADGVLMKSIARIGRGRFYATMDPSTVPRIFTKETVEASRSAIREEPFSPVRIGDADAIRGLDFGDAPLLLGYVMTRAKPTAQVQLLTEAGDPLLALGRYGLGHAVAFTSDASGKWASQWIEWRGYGRFWSQILRACVRKSDSSGLTVRRKVGPKNVRILLTSKDKASSPLSGQVWDALLTHENGSRSRPSVREVGLGMYEVEVERPEAGGFSLRLHEPGTEKLRVVHHHEDYPAEYRLSSKLSDTITRLPRLSDLASVTDLPPCQARRPARNVALLAAMACLIGSVLLRRL